jgi:hypothetical protein
VDILNAFIGKPKKPTVDELHAALGSSANVWKQLVDELAQEHDVKLQEWKSISPKYGWSLRLKLKKRTIVHLSPCNGCFWVLFILGDRAVKAAREGTLPKSVVNMVEDAPRYTEGTGVRLLVKGAADVDPIRKLVAIKLAN